MSFLFRYQDVFDELNSLENKLKKVNEELPGDWLLHKDIIDKVKKIDLALESSISTMESSEAGDIQRRVDARFTILIRKIKRHLFLVGQYLRKVDQGKFTNELKANLLDSMQVLSDTLHKLAIDIQQYPIHKIRKRKILQMVLKQMQLGFMMPSDINYEDAKKLITHFIHEELILLVKYKSDAEPYLVVTMAQGKLNFYILKRTAHNYGLIASKLMALLGIRHMVIDTKRKFIDGKIQHLNSIQKMEGMELLTLRKIADSKEALALAFLIGAACADGFAINLADRPWNLFIDYKEFRRIYRKNYLHYLGNKNPVFHIDYEQLDIMDDAKYLHHQYFGFSGIFVELLIRMVDFKSAKLTVNQVVESFNNGYLSELKYIKGFYIRNRSEIDSLLARNGLTNLMLRFSERSYPLLIKIEHEVVPELKSKLHIA